MIENKNNLVKELDFELDSLEEIIKNIENENRVIENRKNKNELFLEKLKIINLFKNDNYE